jgi:predicted nucleotidyltransferase
VNIESTEHPWLNDATCLVVEVGSTLHGISAGSDDLDQMGVCVEPMSAAFGLGGIFKQDIYRTAEIREGRKGVPSHPGDTDRVIYSLRKWVRLALDGNPSVILLLFAPQEKVWHCDERGAELRSMAEHFASKRAGNAFRGYLISQRQRLLGERGQKNVTRAELTEKFGYDTKYAAHMIRLGYQGVEYMQTGRLTLPLRPSERDRCLAVRKGEVSMNDMLTECGLLEQKLEDLLDTSPLPDDPNEALVETWMLDQYWQAWTDSVMESRR